MVQVKIYVLNCSYSNNIPRVSIENETYVYKELKMNDIVIDRSIANLFTQENRNNKKQLPTIIYIITPLLQPFTKRQCLFLDHFKEGLHYRMKKHPQTILLQIYIIRKNKC